MDNKEVKRKTGYYWVRFPKCKSIIANYINDDSNYYSDEWYVTGNLDSFKDSDFEFINERMIEEI